MRENEPNSQALVTAGTTWRLQFEIAYGPVPTGTVMSAPPPPIPGNVVLMTSRVVALRKPTRPPPTSVSGQLSTASKFAARSAAPAVPVATVGQTLWAPCASAVVRSSWISHSGPGTGLSGLKKVPIAVARRGQSAGIWSVSPRPSSRKSARSGMLPVTSTRKLFGPAPATSERTSAPGVGKPPAGGAPSGPGGLPTESTGGLRFIQPTRKSCLRIGLPASPTTVPPGRKPTPPGVVYGPPIPHGKLETTSLICASPALCGLDGAATQAR